MKPIYLVLAAIGGGLATALIITVLVELAFAAGRTDLYAKALECHAVADSIRAAHPAPTRSR